MYESAFKFYSAAAQGTGAVAVDTAANTALCGARVEQKTVDLDHLTTEKLMDRREDDSNRNGPQFEHFRILEAKNRLNP